MGRLRGSSPATSGTVGCVVNLTMSPMCGRERIDADEISDSKEATDGVGEPIEGLGCSIGGSLREGSGGSGPGVKFSF